MAPPLTRVHREQPGSEKASWAKDLHIWRSQLHKTSGRELEASVASSIAAVSRTSPGPMGCPAFASKYMALKAEPRTCVSLGCGELGVRWHPLQRTICLFAIYNATMNEMEDVVGSCLERLESGLSGHGADSHQADEGWGLEETHVVGGVEPSPGFPC
jgi:hypothetical protein